MKKHLQRLLLLAALLVPWVTQAQTLSEYTFTTGVDASKWITLSSPTTIFSTGVDDQASSLYNIGFSFPFGDDSYTQFSVSSNGIFKLGSPAASSSTTAGQFNSSNYTTSLPKICGVAKDIGTAGTGYVRYQLTGTAPNRVLVCEYLMGYTYSATTSDVAWQVQLHEDSAKVVIVYGSTAPATNPSSYQTGLATAGNDIVILNPSTHAALYQTTYYATTYSTWHGANRYYSFKRPVVTCPAPTGFTASTTTTDSVVVTWTAGGTETSWEVSNGTTSTIVTSTGYTFTGLTANTNYTFHVRGICGAGDTSAWRNLAVRTPCGTVTLPYIENFDTYTTSTTAATGVSVPCWDKIMTGTSTYQTGSYLPQIYYGSSNAHSGNYSYRLYGVGYHMLPPLGIPLDSVRLTFWDYTTSTSYGLEVGVMEGTTFVPIQTITTPSSTHLQHEVTFGSYTGSSRIIAFRNYYTSSTSTYYSYHYLDNVEVRKLPDCPHVNNLAASNITINSANISWTDANASSWKVWYYPTSSPSSIDSLVVTTPSAALTNLSVGTNYTAIVAPVCTTGEGITEEATLTFITECYPIDSLPYTMGFETADGVTSTGSSTSTTWMPCWHRLNNATQYFGYPYVYSSAYHTGSRGLYWYMNTTTGTYADYEYVVLPAVDTDAYAISGLQLRFWAKATSVSYRPVFQVGVMTDPYNINTFQLVKTIEINPVPLATTDWTECLATFEDYVGEGTYIAVRALRPASAWYAYTDDFVLEELSACPRVEELHASRVSDNAADITWTDRGNTGTYEFVYYPTSTPSLADTLTIYDTTINIPGLTASTNYTVIVTPVCAGTTLPHRMTFVTRCAPLDTLPYTMGFETADGVSSTGSSTSVTWVTCWGRLNNATQYFGYPYVSSSSTYNHTTDGTKGLYWYNYNTTATTYGSYQCIVLPGVDTDTYAINTLRLKFWAKASGTSYYPVFQVGVMTDPEDINTFQLVQTISVGNSTNWQEYIASFVGMSDSIYGQYIAVRALNTTGSWYAYVDDFTLEMAPQCPPIVNMNVEATGTTGAFITWGYEGGTLGTPQEYDIEYYEVGNSSSLVALNDTLPQVFITGLDTNTTYCVRVRGNCYTYDYGTWDSITFTTNGLGCAVFDPDATYTDTLDAAHAGSGSSGTNYYIPVNNYYNYSYTQEIVLASELNGPGSITGIDYQYNYSTAMTSKTNCTIYLANTTTSNLSSAFVPYGNDFQMVYTGPLNCSQGWNHFEFTEPFAYDGSSNLLIVVQDNSGSYNSSSYTFDHHTTSTALGRHVYNDGSAYNIASVSGGSSVSYRTNMMLHFTSCAQQATCGAPMVRVTRVESREAEIDWAAGLSETAWDVEYRMANEATWTTAVTGTTSMNYTLLNLQPATEYEVRVSYYCATDTVTYESVVSFTTPCEPYEIPFYENFDSYVAAQATQLGPCWYKHHTNASYSYSPYVYSTYSHSGSNSLYFYYGYSTSYATYLVLPQMADNLQSLELSFWEYKTSASYGLCEVGIITDPEDLTTFIPVDTVQVDATSTWQQFFVNFLNYDGPDGRIALVARTSNSYYFYIDDIEVNRFSTCPRVQNLNVSRVTNDSAYLSWSGDTATSNFRIWWGTTDQLSAATDSADLSDMNVGLGPFGPNATVYVWVAQFCDGGAMSAPVRTVFTTAADCEVVTDLYIHHVTSNSAAFTWTEPQGGYPATSYRVSWQSTTGTRVIDTTPHAFYILTGLDTVTTYTFSVQAICEHQAIVDSSFWVSRTFTTHSSRCNYITGNGTSTSTSSSPLYTSSPYSFGHMLFFAEELAQMGDTITGLTFNVTTSGSITRDVDVYIGNADITSMFSAGAGLHHSDLTQVYSGNWTVTQGQCTLTFDTLFVRDHGRNLVVAFDDNTGTQGTSYSFSAYTTLDANTGDVIYTVHYNYASADVDPATGPLMYLTNARPIVTFQTTCASETCSSPVLVASGNSDSTINLYWNANSGSAWRVEYRIPTDSVWTVADTNVTTNSYVLGGLQVATRYQIRVGSICSPTNIIFTPVFANTACGDVPVPYTDDFNDIYNGYFERPCWRVGNAGGQAREEYTYPYVRNYTQYGPMFRLARGGYAVLPHFAEPLYNLQVRFVYRSAIESSYEIFGYLTDPDDINTLVVIDTLWPNANAEGLRLYTINLDFLPGDAEGNLCFYVPHSLNDNNLIDNLVVDVIPPCAIPDSLTCSYAGDTTADLSWYMTNVGSATYMLRYTAYRSGVYDTVYTNGTNFTLTGLIPGTTYDAECFSICLRTGDTSLASDICRFTTQCAPLPTLPYYLTFENIPLSTTQTLPNCWEIPASNTTSAAALPQCVFEASNAASGYYYVRVQSTSAIAMPQFVAPPDSLMISFYMKTATAGDSVEVGVIDTMAPFVFTPMDTFITSGTMYEFFSAYFVGYTGPGVNIGIRTLSDRTVYIDNLTIDYAPTCLPVRRLRADTATASSITLAWNNLTAASQYEIEYGNAGFTRGNGTLITVNTNPVIVRGLTPMTNYDFYVRPICSVGDTADWSAACRATTEMCDNLVTANSWDSLWTTTTHSYAPLGSSFYNYGYVQTLIDAARFAEVEDAITAFAFNPETSAQGNYFNHIDVYMANVSESDLSAGFIMPDSNHQFVQVLHDADLSYATVGWQLHSFDTAFVWDGHSNVLFVVNRAHGTYSSGASFYAHNTSTIKTRYLYTDGSAYDPYTVTGGTTANVIGDLRFFSCAANCERPEIDSITGDYQSATLTWLGTGNAYQVSYRTGSDTNWTTPVDVTGNTYTFANLQPLTNYEFRVRQDCTADSLDYSAWIGTFFRTDTLPCYVPDSLTVTGVTNTSATFSWVPVGDETAWDIRVYNTASDTIYHALTTIPSTVGGLTAGVTYNAAIRALCGLTQNTPGDWSDSIQFTTQICPMVTGVATSNVTFNSVTLTWTAATNAQSYEVEYGVTGFNQGNGTTVTSQTNSINITGLQDETSYQFYVRAVCGTNWLSENWSAPVSVTTSSAPSVTFTVSATVNPANSGSVTGTGTYGEGDTATLTATPATGYHFNNWNDNVTLNPRSVVVTSDTSFIAYFALNQYTVTVTSADPTRGTVTGNGTYNHGDVATLTATAATGYHFSQWNDGDTHATRAFVVTSDTTFTAAFAPNQYTVTATANDDAYGTVTGGGLYDFRDTASLTATANTGYYFQRWNDGNVDNPRVFVVTGDVSYTAIFASDSVPPVQTYTVTLSANDPNMGIVNGGGTFAEGSTVEISAIANAGYRFVEWNDGVTDNPRTFVLTCDTTFTATFAEQVDSTAVLVVSCDADMGYVLINGTAAATYNGLLGDEVSLEAVALEGYHFVDWSDGETSRTRTLTLTQSRTTLTANFAVGANGIATVEGNVSCLIYPNPATSSTTISVSGANGKVRITVVDINGRVAASETMECAGDCVKTMNVDNLAQGAYFVRITGENVNMVKKLIVR